VEVTDRRTKKDYAECLRKIADQRYPDAEVVVLVQDNLNTHSPASLYEAFEPAEAKRLTDRFEFHYTPKHGSWLDMAEIELVLVSSEGAQRCGPCRGGAGERSTLDVGDHLSHVVELGPGQSILPVVRDAHRRISEPANHIFYRREVKAGREDPIFP
jgi:hypothetical protein